MFSVHTISSSMNDVLKSLVPARTVPAGTRSNHVLGTNRPLSTHPKQVWTLCYREQCSKWAGLSTQTAYQHRECTLKWPHTLRSVYTISHTAQTEMCAHFKSERRGTENISQCSQYERSCTENLFREHFAGVVYREHIWTGPNIFQLLKWELKT